MDIFIKRDDLLIPLQKIIGVVERRQTLPILGNLLMSLHSDDLTVTATDLEVQVKTTVKTRGAGDCDFTLPARKLTDIWKALPEGTDVRIAVEGDRARLHAGKSRFTLSTLPAQDYPSIEPSIPSQVFTLQEGVLKKLVEKTQFAMALQDVRYYLNGLLLEVKNGAARTVATDGHRLALCEAADNVDEEIDIQVIVPRKSVSELNRLLGLTKSDIRIALSSNHIRVEMGETILTSKLIDGRFPEYGKVIPTSKDEFIVVDRELLRQALSRTSILSNEKYRGIRLRLEEGKLQLLAHNPEQEEAEEEIDIDYQGDEMVVGFNVGYLIDVLSAIEEDQVRIELHDANTSTLIRGLESEDCQYVVMPMRI